MSRDGSTTFFYGDAEHRFVLTIGGLQELEEKCNAGGEEILLRILSRRQRTLELREILRLGLIGGGMAPAEVNVLLGRYFDPPERPKLEAKEPAARILSAALQGAPDEPLGKAEPAGENATATATPAGTGGQNGPTSTEPPERSDSPLPTSNGGVFGNTLQ